MTEVSDYYRLLGVSPDADDVVINAAYRALMKKYHPDTFHGDKLAAEARAKKLNEAYEILRDPARRAKYNSQRQGTKPSGFGEHAEHETAKPESSAASATSTNGSSASERQRSRATQRHSTNSSSRMLTKNRAGYIIEVAIFVWFCAVLYAGGHGTDTVDPGAAVTDQQASTHTGVSAGSGTQARPLSSTSDEQEDLPSDDRGASDGNPQQNSTFCNLRISSAKGIFCANTNIISLNNEMMQLYSQLTSADGADVEMISSEQTYWERFVRDACGDIACVENSYQSRISLLSLEADNPPKRATGDQQQIRTIALQFYRALGDGDGRAAAALIVPDRQDGGPLSADSLRHFYGGLVQPLTIDDVEVLPKGRARVKYHYAASKSRVYDCTSILTLTEEYGALRIASVQAQDGC